MSDASDDRTGLDRRGLLGLGAALALGATLPARARAQEAAAAPRVIYAVRHAEKAAGNDPELTPAGAARAATLARVLSDVPLAAVYSTSPKRTQATAAPTAEAKKLSVTTYHPAKLTKMLAQQAGPALVVGHSNTTPALLRELGVSFDVEELGGYDDLFLVVLVPGAPAVFQHLRYGEPTAEGSGHM